MRCYHACCSRSPERGNARLESPFSQVNVTLSHDLNNKRLHIFSVSQVEIIEKMRFQVNMMNDASKITVKFKQLSDI